MRVQSSAALDVTRMDAGHQVDDSVSFFVQVSKGARGDRQIELAWPFKKVLFNKLLYVPVAEILLWHQHLGNLTKHLANRQSDDRRFWEIGHDLMAALRVPLAKGMTRNPWSKIVALYTYQEFQNVLREITTDRKGPLADIQTAWEAEFSKFSGLEGAIPAGTNLPVALAEAIAAFYKSEAQHKLPAAVALFLGMRAINTDPRYTGHLAKHTELAVYRGVLEGSLDIDPPNDLAVQYVRNLRKSGAPVTRPLPPQPAPFEEGSSSWWLIALLVLFIGSGLGALALVLTVFLVWLSQWWVS